jgi:uncharacterized membrane protein
MSNVNPYSSSPSIDGSELGRRITIRPIALIQQAYEFIRSDYWLFLGLSLVAMIIGSLVPFGILLGPMMVGLCLCFREREEGKQTSFDTLFRGFDSFGTSLVALLIHLAIFFAVFMVLMIPFAIGMALLIPAIENGGAAGGVIMTVLVAGFYIGFMLFSMVLQFAMLLSFQLIADKGLSAWDAVLGGYKLVYKNLFGIIGYAIVVAIVSILLMIMCFIPFILFMPIFYASLFLMYREMCPRNQAGLA